MIVADPRREARGVHWDNGQLRLAESADKVGDLQFSVQGVLYLVDTPAENGAFTVVPGFHRVISSWLKDLPPGAAPAQQDYLEMKGAGGKGLTRVPAGAGDLIIWQTTLPHYSAVNIGDAPRIAQYITMGPAATDQQDEAARASRIAFWRERKAGNGNADKPAGAKTREQPVAELSALARKVAGIDPWEEGDDDDDAAAGGGGAFAGLTDEWKAPSSGPDAVAKL
eukprot:SAG22_NODE_207_length_15278_cov_4.056855_7_plen_225_part_00